MRVEKLHNRNTVENIFSTPRDKSIIQQIADGEKSNYEQIISGKKSNLTVMPTIYEFNKNIGVHDTMQTESLSQIADLIKDENPKEYKKIDKFLSQINWQLSEWEIFDEISLFFSKCSGLAICGYEPKNFLRVFVKDAEY